MKKSHQRRCCKSAKAVGLGKAVRYRCSYSGCVLGSGPNSAGQQTVAGVVTIDASGSSTYDRDESIFSEQTVQVASGRQTFEMMGITLSGTDGVFPNIVLRR